MSMRALLDVPAPAKLNLFLHITGRRPDGYHLLQSVFMLIDWCDTLHFEKRAGGSISREDLTTPLPPADLITRAAELLQQLRPEFDRLAAGLVHRTLETAWHHKVNTPPNP